jgi:hypothetical protein
MDGKVNPVKTRLNRLNPVGLTGGEDRPVKTRLRLTADRLGPVGRLTGTGRSRLIEIERKSPEAETRSPVG